MGLDSINGNFISLINTLESPAFITLGRKPQPFKAGDEALPGARRSCLAEEVCGMLWPWTIGRERIQSTD